MSIKFEFVIFLRPKIFGYQQVIRKFNNDDLLLLTRGASDEGMRELQTESCIPCQKIPCF